MGKLTAVQVGHWIKAGKPIAKSDGEGLTFTLSANGVAAWVLRYRYGGKAKELTLGRYPDMTLADARQIASRRRLDITNGIDVAQAKRTARLEAKNARTVSQLADDYLKDLKKRGKSAKSVDWHFSAYIKPKFGYRNVDEVRPKELLDYFQSIAKRTPATALAIFGTMRRMYEFAIVRQVIELSPAASIKPHAIAEKKARERNLSVEELGKLLRAISSPANPLSEGQRIALRMLLWTLGRKSEVTGMAWAEYNGETGIWTLPEERAKNGRQHLIPLPKQAISALARMKELGASSEWVFPGKSGDTPMSANSLNERMTRSNRMGVDHWRIHDLRRTGSTMLHEMGFAPHIIERALNHVQEGVAAVYNKALWLDERAVMLQQWADYLAALEDGATVLPFKARVA